MLNLSKTLITVAVFASCGQAFATPPPPAGPNKGHIQRLGSDRCDGFGISEAHGRFWYCSQKVPCANGKSMAVYYTLYHAKGGDTLETATDGVSCSAESSHSYEACRAEPETAEMNQCWNKAIADGKLNGVRSVPENGPAVSCGPHGGGKGAYATISYSADGYHFSQGNNRPGSEDLHQTHVRLVDTGADARTCTFAIKTKKNEPMFSISVERGKPDVKLEKSFGGIVLPDVSCKINPDVARQICPQIRTDSAPTTAPLPSGADAAA